MLRPHPQTFCPRARTGPSAEGPEAVDGCGPNSIHSLALGNHVRIPCLHAAPETPIGPRPPTPSYFGVNTTRQLAHAVDTDALARIAFQTLANNAKHATGRSHRIPRNHPSAPLASVSHWKTYLAQPVARRLNLYVSSAHQLFDCRTRVLLASTRANHRNANWCWQRLSKHLSIFLSSLQRKPVGPAWISRVRPTLQST